MAIIPELTEPELGPVLGPVEVGPVAHGGHCVARFESRVIFVRHALPGETVRVQITDTSHDRFWRGDAVEVLDASADRVPSECPISGPGGCGGCDFQHVSLPGQRELKRAVVAEQLQRLAGLAWEGSVESLGTEDGLGWRTRMRYHVDDSGRLGLRPHRSHEVLPVPAGGCPIAAPPLAVLAEENWSAGADLQTAVSGAGEVAVVAGRELARGPAVLTERAAGHEFSVAADGFWQVHPAAADTLVSAVLDGLAPRAGERAFDLYCGVGLFTWALADAGCRVWGVESDPMAIGHARANVPGARFTVGRVDRVLRKLPKRTELVVLDPPRTGAGRQVVAQVCERRPRAIAYVACDPAALARDLAYAAKSGYALSSLRAFDLFPMTHHVECVAILQIAADRAEQPRRPF